jgi:chemotaxis regulatin CheY-phosphate phosphatase CheZ
MGVLTDGARKAGRAMAQEMTRPLIEEMGTIGRMIREYRDILPDIDRGIAAAARRMEEAAAKAPASTPGGSGISAESVKKAYDRR